VKRYGKARWIVQARPNLSRVFSEPLRWTFGGGG